MIQTSGGYLAAVNRTSREWSARLASSGTAINAEIMSVTIHKGTRGDELNVGTMYASYYEAVVRGYSGGSLLGSTLTFDLGLTVSGATEWATIATGTVISAKAQGNDLLLTLAGPISSLGDQSIESTSTAVTDVVTEIQTKLGTTVTCRDGITSLTGTLAAAMTGQTIRGALQSLAAFFGGYVTENAAGQIVIGGLSQTSTTAISPDTYQEEPELSTGTYEITGWRVFVNSETYYLDGTEPYLDTACQFMTQAQFNAVKADIIGEVFRGGSIDQTLGNPLIEPWDVLTLTGSAETMPRLGTVTITYDGGVSVRIESPVTSDDEQPAQVVGPLSGQVAEAAAVANSAKTSADEALETAQEVNNHFYVDSAGLHVTLLESSPNTGQNILIDSDGMDIRNGTTVKAHFGEVVQVGENNQSHIEIEEKRISALDDTPEKYWTVGDQNGSLISFFFTGNGANDQYALPFNVAGGNIEGTVIIEGVVVTIDGVAQVQGTDYTVLAPVGIPEAVIAFSVAPSNGAVIEVTVTPNSLTPYFIFAGQRSGTNTGPFSFNVGINSEASGVASYAEGKNTRATSGDAHAEGAGTVASGAASHAEGAGTTASGEVAHAEGWYTTASGRYSHAEGIVTVAAGMESHAEGGGSQTTSTGSYGHAEGHETVADAAAHSEGDGTTASGYASHAEGGETVALMQYDHAQNLGTIAYGGAQTAIGKYNERRDSTIALIIGNGTDDNNRSNALTVDWDGDVAMSGDLSVGGDASIAGGLTLAGHSSSIGTLAGDTASKSLTNVNASTSWQQVSSVSLTQGRWLIKGWASFNGSTAGVRYIYITTNSAPASSTVAAVGNFSQYMAANAHGLVSGVYIADVGSTTTWRLFVKTTAGTPAVPYCQLEAIRIR